MNIKLLKLITITAIRIHKIKSVKIVFYENRTRA